MSVVLLANYLPDQQESMQRFAKVLHDQLQARGLEVELVRPTARWGGFGDPYRGWSKWCGYVDKYLVFPRTLRRYLRAVGNKRTVVHVCDQANAVYVRLLAEVPHLITCSDLLAIRAASGEVPEHRPRWTGRCLQSSILRALNRAQRVTCISEATRRDLLRLTQLQPSAVDVTPMGLNYPFKPMGHDEATARLKHLAQQYGVEAPSSFLLHVGGNQWYKNRLGLLKIYLRLRQIWPSAPPLILVGKALPDNLRSFIEEHGLTPWVLSWSHCGDEELRSLYSLATLMIFPSIAEGFGWPIIEAQACGCRVVTTNRPPMTEVGGASAIYIAPENIETAAAAICRAMEGGPRRDEQGLRNAASYSTEAMIEKYLSLYETARLPSLEVSTLQFAVSKADDP